ncbi:Transcription factor Adf-1 [Liparis tanakae]|uniref:Transcription factor Adf-1 n=1 Tax=Liparis tanakae TaxID=230148 RepID=A0A4Z2FKN8_9TELE|nr:Transcription factor Adf-1 [Liparis tanakae]
MEDKIIVAVCGHPVLYNTTLFEYRNRNKKDEAWKRVGEAVGLPDEICRRRWKSLRDTFQREKKRESNEKRSGSAAQSTKKWKYSAVMSFLVSTRPV